MAPQHATKGAARKSAPEARGASRPGVAGGMPQLLTDIQRAAGNRAATQMASRIDRRPGPGGSSGTKIGKLGVVDQDGTGVGKPGLNLRSRPDGGSSTYGRRLRHNDHVHVDKDMGNDWRLVQVTDGHLKGESGYVSGKYVNTNMPDPQATLHRITKGQFAHSLVRRHYGAKNMKTGEDQRFYTNVLYHVNKNAGRHWIKRGKRIDNSGNWPVAVEDTFLEAGRQIWLPGLRFARSLKGTVSSGSWARDTWERVKDVAKKLAAVPAFIAGLVVGAIKSLWDLVKGVVELAYNTVKSLGKNIVRAGKAIYNIITSSKHRKEFLYAMGDLVEKYWYAPGKGFITKWFRRGQFVGYLTAEVITGKLLATVALKSAKLGSRAAKVADFLANKVPRVKKTLDSARRLGEAAKAKTAAAIGKVKNSKVGQATGKAYGKAKEIGGKVKNSKLGKAVGAPGRLVGKGKAGLEAGVRVTAEMIEANAKKAAALAKRKARQLRIKRANQALRKKVTKGADATKAAREVLKRTGDIKKVRKDIAAGVFGKSDEAKAAASHALDAARQKELDDVAGLVKESIAKDNPGVKVEFYDSGSKGIDSDRDITIRVTKDPPVTRDDARKMAALSIQAVNDANQRLVKRRMRPEKDLDTNYYTELHEGAFGGASQIEKSAINRDQTIESLAEARVQMSGKEWRAFKRAQLKSVKPADPYDVSAIEKAIHKEMTDRLKQAERVARNIRSRSKRQRTEKLEAAKRALKAALERKTPVSDRELRQLSSRVKMLEPDAYGAADAVTGVTKIQQPQQRIAALAAKKRAGKELTAEELAQLDNARQTIKAAQSRRRGRAETADEMDALVREANASLGKLKGHTRRRRNGYTQAKDAAKYYERVRHATEGILARKAPGAGGNPALDIMAAKLVGDLDPAALKKILRAWGDARGMSKASDAKVLDAFVAHTRREAAEMAQKAHTSALTKRFANPDARNPKTVRERPLPLNDLDTPMKLDKPLDRRSPVGSAGTKGSLADDATYGVFEGTIGGRPVLVKVYRDKPRFREMMTQEMHAARAAELTGYGGKVHGVVEVKAVRGKAIAFAFERQPGGFITPGSKAATAVKEAERFASRVSDKTVRQLMDYERLLLERGYANSGEFQFFVDQTGNFRPIDLQGAKKLSSDPATRRRQIDSHDSNIDAAVKQLQQAMRDTAKAQKKKGWESIPVDGAPGWRARQSGGQPTPTPTPTSRPRTTRPTVEVPSTDRPTRELNAAKPTAPVTTIDRPTRELRTTKPTAEVAAVDRPTAELKAVRPARDLDLRVEKTEYSTAVYARNDKRAMARVKVENGDLTIEYVTIGDLPAGSGRKLVAAAMRAEGMQGVKRIVSRNIIEPESRKLFEVGGQAADSKIAKMRTRALEELGITVTRESHSWQMTPTGLELITKLP